MNTYTSFKLWFWTLSISGGCNDSGVDNDHDHVIIFFQRHSTV